MAVSVRAIRRFFPNIPLRIRHADPQMHLWVRLRHHLGLIARGAAAYEPTYVEVLRTCIQRGDVVFDVGANIGFYASLFSKWVGREGHVVAFEPDLDNVRLLRKNLRKSPNTVVRSVAVGATRGVCAFSRDIVTGHTGHVGEGPSYGEVRFGLGQEHRIEVPVTTLDSEVEASGMAPEVVKIDAEGGEYEILSGGTRVLGKQRPVIVSEVSNWRYEMLRQSRPGRAVVELLLDFHYIVYDLDRGQPVGVSDQPWMVIAVPEERRSEPRVARALVAAGAGR